jgi:Ca-activated chloride channel homolog
MVTFLSSIHFIRPLWLIGLFLLPFFLFFLLKQQGNNSPWKTFCEPHLVKELLVTTRIFRKWLFPLGLLLTWFLAIIALSGPAWIQEPQPLFQNRQAAVIAVDLSSAMDASDLLPNRMLRAKLKIFDLLKSLNGQIGMVAFASEAYEISPLTEDYHTLELLVNDLTSSLMPVDGSDLRVALIKSAELIHQAGEKKGHIFILTAHPAQTQDIQIAATLAHQGIKTSILGIGSFTPSQTTVFPSANFNDQTLKQLAQAGGGVYQRFSNTNEDIHNLLSTPGLQLQGSDNLAKTKILTMKYKDEGIRFILCLLPFALFMFRKKSIL